MAEDRLQVVSESEDETHDAGDERERIVRLSTALAEVEMASDGGALVPVESVAPLVSAIVDALGGPSRGAPPESSLAQRRQTIRDEAAQEARSRYRLSRVGSGTVAAVTSALWLLPQLVLAFGGEAAVAALQASLLAPLFALELFDPVAFGLALYAWLFFGMTWLMEQNDLRRIDWVTTDAARSVLLKRAVLKARQRGEQDSITKADMREAIGHGLRPTVALRLLGARDVTASFLDRVTTYHIGELAAQGVLAPSTKASLSPRYLVAEEVTKDLMP
jgi:hypothetical protein